MDVSIRDSHRGLPLLSSSFSSIGFVSCPALPPIGPLAVPCLPSCGAATEPSCPESRSWGASGTMALKRKNKSFLSLLSPSRNVKVTPDDGDSRSGASCNLSLSPAMNSFILDADSRRYSADQSDDCDTSSDTHSTSSRMLDSVAELPSRQLTMRRPSKERVDAVAMDVTLTTERFNKPLPHLPSKQKARILPGRARLALAAVSTNLRAKRDVIGSADSPLSPRKGPGVYVLQASPLIVRDPSPSSPAGFKPHPHSPRLDDGYIQPVTSGRAAAMLGKRIEALAVQHDRSLQQSRHKTMPGSIMDGSQSRFYKGKEAFGRVKEIINRRFNSNAEQHPDANKYGSPLMRTDSEDSSSFEDSECQSANQRGLEPGALRSQTPLEHLIPRKPVGSRDGERSKKGRERFSFLKDPFSNLCDVESSAQPDACQERSSSSCLNLSLDSSKVRRNDKHPRGRQLHRSPIERDGYTYTNLLGSSADTIPRQCAPAIDLLSSSPDEYSTPRLRLEPRVEPDGRTRLMSVRSDRIANLGAFSFEKDHERENIWVPSDMDSQLGKEPPSSLKRKSSGRRDGSTSPTPAHKKLKQQVSTQEENLAASMAELQMPLPLSDTTKSAKTLLRRFNRVRGMGMFDIRNTSGKNDVAWVKL